MAKNWMLKLDDKIKREREKSSNHYRKALELSEKIRNKYNCSLAELPLNRLSDEEKKIIFNAWLELGYSKETASLIVYNNKYHFKLI